MHLLPPHKKITVYDDTEERASLAFFVLCQLPQGQRRRTVGRRWAGGAGVSNDAILRLPEDIWGHVSLWPVSYIHISEEQEARTHIKIYTAPLCVFHKT